MPEALVGGGSGPMCVCDGDLKVTFAALFLACRDTCIVQL